MTAWAFSKNCHDYFLSFRGLPGFLFSTFFKSFSLIIQSRPNFSAGSRPDNINCRTRESLTISALAACFVVRIFIIKFDYSVKSRRNKYRLPYIVSISSNRHSMWCSLIFQKLFTMPSSLLLF